MRPEPFSIAAAAGMNSWLILLGEERTPAQLRLSSRRRSKIYREKHPDKLREMEKARNPLRREYFKTRRDARRPIMRQYMREYMRDYRRRAV